MPFRPLWSVQYFLFQYTEVGCTSFVFSGYRKVGSINASQLKAQLGFIDWFIKGKFDVNLLCPSQKN